MVARSADIEINKHWPYMHFAEKHGDTLGIVLWLLNEVEVIAVNKRSIGCRSRIPTPWAGVMTWLFDAMNALYEANDISDADNIAMSDEVLAVLNRLPGTGPGSVR